jgi:hypothetical protein
MLFLSFKPLQGQTEPRVGHQCAVAPYNAGVRCHGSCFIRKAADLPTMESRRLHRSKMSSVKAVEVRKAKRPKVECEIVSRAIGYLQPVADHRYKTTLIS